MDLCHTFVFKSYLRKEWRKKEIFKFCIISISKLRETETCYWYTRTVIKFNAVILY